MQLLQIATLLHTTQVSSEGSQLILWQTSDCVWTVEWTVEWTGVLANKRSFNKRFNAKFTIVLFA